MGFGPFLFLTTAEGGHAILTRRRKPTNRKDHMYGPQIERLKRDEKELRHYIKRLEKEGNDNLAFKLQKKQAYLNTRIEEMYEVTR